MLLTGEHYPAITIHNLVDVLINEVKTGRRSTLILDTRPLEEFRKQHIIGAQHFDRFILSRPRYESEAMLNAKRNGFTVIICGENYTAADVVSTLRQRDYNAALLRSTIDVWKQKYPLGLLTKTDDDKLDIVALASQYAENTRPSIEKRNFLRGTSSSRNKNVSRDERIRRQSKETRRPWR
uniref:Rhodanese domain-containing protein n=1 Tax=Ascaris lumbricoides TaxID=6252 RepID=A0A0M3I3N1_ASCLU